MKDLWLFYQEQYPKLLEQLVEHLGLTFAALLLACLVGIPFGILITRRPRWARLTLGVSGVLQTIPSLALLGLMIPLLGIGPLPAITALFAYSLLPIVRNTYTGLQEVSPEVLDAARGMGMTSRQLLFQVRLPLALPVLFAGVRTAAVIDVGVATLASYVAAGGLGEFIFGGIALNNGTMIVAGALPAALLALLIDAVLQQVQQMSAPNLRRSAGLLLVLGGLLAYQYAQPWLARRELLAGFTPEFTGRSDGYPKLREVYQLRLNTVMLGPALMYDAVRNGTVDLICGYSTDGRIPAYGLEVLKDDRHALPPYQAGLLLDREFARRYPAAGKVARLLSGRLSDSLMRRLNFRVDENNERPQAVARSFLEQANLLDHNLPDEVQEASPKPEQVAIGSKIFSEQYILAEMLGILWRHHLGWDVQTQTGLGGTKICFEALQAGEIQAYFEYSGTGWQVLLDDSTRRRFPEAAGDEGRLYGLVDSLFRQRYALQWMPPLGFNNSYALMMRREQARRLGIASISDVRRYLADERGSSLSGLALPPPSK